MILALLLLLQDAQAFRDKGAKVVEAGGAVVSIDAGDVSSWTEADFKALAALPSLRTLSFSKGLTDASLEWLSGAPALETLQTNLSGMTDDGTKALAKIRTLKALKLFHPAKAFTGTGLAHLADLPELRSLTVAGSYAFGDAGMEAVAKLVRLQEFRTWHAGQTIEGVRHLRGLTSLRSLTLGQVLAYKPPTTLSDETLAVLADMPSLEILQLEEARLTPEALRRLKALPKLKTLTLRGIEIPEADLEGLRRELSHAKIDWTPPTPAYQKRIRALFGP